MIEVPVKDLDWYLESIRHEIAMVNKEFVGSLAFRINIKQGVIGNMNINLDKSVKKL